MQEYLYNDLYLLENTHWWHKAKRTTVLILLRKYLKTKGIPQILDVGCGTGANLEAFTTLGNAWGLDNAKKAISYCKQRKLSQVKLGDATNIPFKNHTFDAVTFLDVLEHVDDKKALEEAGRILNKNGVVVITVPAYSFLWSRWDEVLGHKRRYTRRQLVNLLEQGGFRMLKVSYMYSFLVLPVSIIRFIKTKILKSDYGSDFTINNGITNQFLSAVSDFERQIIITTGLPFGMSIVCLAKKI